jgi:polar amino acid transport system permease protein
VYAVIAVLYFVVCYPLSQALLWFERQVRAGVPLLPRRRRRMRGVRAMLREEVVA